MGHSQQADALQDSSKRRPQEACLHRLRDGAETYSKSIKLGIYRRRPDVYSSSQGSSAASLRTPRTSRSGDLPPMAFRRGGVP